MPPVAPVRVLLADDHALVRAGIRALLHALPGVEVVAEAGNGRQALDLTGTAHPDVVIMDIGMPGLNGIEATARLSASHPGVRVLILSMHSSEEHVLHALRAGASGYLIKTADREELERAVRAVAGGETYLSPSVSRQVVGEYLRRTAGDPSPSSRLTSRQREILQLIAEGHNTKSMARVLSVSIKTVETHRAVLMQRLGIHDTAGLVRYALRIGLVDAGYEPAEKARPTKPGPPAR